MLARFVTFIGSLWRALLGLLKRAVSPPTTLTTTFENLTAGTVTVWRGAAGAPDRVLHRTLRRGEHYEQQTTVGEVWTIDDDRSGWTIVEYKIDRYSTGIYATDFTLATPPPGPAPAMPEVHIEFRNPTHLDLELSRLDIGDTVLQTERCPAGHVVGVGTQGRAVWSVRTVEMTVTGGGMIPGGVELGRYLIGDQDAEYVIENTIIGFENQTLMTVEVTSTDRGGSVTTYGTLGPMEYTYLSNALARHWDVRIPDTDVVLDDVVPIWVPRLVEVRSARVPRGTADTDDRWLVENTTPFTVDVEQLDERGVWRKLTRLEPAQRGEVHALAQTTLRARERWTARVVAAWVTPQGPHDEFPWRIELPASTSSLTSAVHVANETHLYLELVVPGTNATPVPLAPHQTYGMTLPLGQHYFVRDVRSGAIIAIEAAERVQPIMRPRSSKLRSQPQGDAALLHIENALGQPVVVVEVDEFGREAKRSTLAPDETEPYATTADQVVRFLRVGSGAIVREHITLAGDQTVSLEVPSSPSGPTTSITVINHTRLDLDVFFVEDAGDGQVVEDLRFQLGHGSSVDIQTYAGTSFVTRDHHSATLIDGFVATRQPRAVEITSSALRSAPVYRSRPVQLVNESGIDDLIIAAAPSWETASNDQTERLRRANVDLELQIVLIPGTSDSPRGGAVYPGALYRAVSSSLGAVVAEWIATAADTRWTIGANFVRTVTGATAALHEGEIAFYGPKGLDDNAVVIDQTISHLGTIPGFPSKVGAVRVGPRTAAEITTSGSSPTTVSVTIDRATLDGTPLAAGSFSSCHVERQADPAEYGISHRADLVQDYNENGEEYTSFRTTITVPSNVSDVQIWTAGLQLTADGKPTSQATSLIWVDGSGTTQRLDIGTNTKQIVPPNDLGKVTFSIEATDLSAPELLFRTNTMAVDDVLSIRPDLVMHQRAADLPAGSLYEAASSLQTADRDRCDQAQTAVQNMARTVQSGAQPTSHGFANSVTVSPTGMSHPHWQYDLQQHVYKPMTAGDATAATAHAEFQLDPLEQSALGDLFDKYVSGARQIIVHTAKKVEVQVKSTTAAVSADADATWHKMQHDGDRAMTNATNALRHGDVAGAFGSMAKGAVGIATDGATGAATIVHDAGHGIAAVTGDIVEGADQIAILTIDFGETAVQFALTHPEAVGALMLSVLKRAEIAAESAMAWLRSHFSLQPVFDTADAIKDVLHHVRDSMDDRVQRAKDDIVKLTAQLDKDVDDAVAAVCAGIDAGRQKQQPPSPQDAAAREKIDWLLSHLFASKPSGAAPAPGPAPTPGTPDDDPISLSEGVTNIGKGIDSLIADALVAPSQLGTDLANLFGSIAKEVIGVTEHVVLGLLDAAVDSVEALFGADQPIEVPVVSAAFHVHSTIDVVALVLAVPTTILYGDEHQMTAAEALAAVTTGELPPLSYEQIVYGDLEIALGIVQTALAAAGGRSARRTEIVLAFVSRIVDVVAVVVALPQIQWSGYAESEASEDEIIKAPDLIGTGLIIIQVVSLVMNLIGDGLGAKKTVFLLDSGTRVVDEGSGTKVVVECIAGVVTFVGATVLVFAEGIKVGHVRSLISPSPKTLGYRNYVNWGVPGSLAKYFQGVLAAAPDIMSLRMLPLLTAPEAVAAAEKQQATIDAVAIGASTTILALRMATQAMY